jgi:sec-independent protein translocase protein TatC
MPLIPERFRRRSRRDPEATMTLVEHLEELRTRLFIAIGSVTAGSVVGWFLYGPVLRLLQKPYCDTLNNMPKANRPPTGCRFVFTGVLEPTLVKLKVVVFIGLFIALPIVLWQLWAFITPGLRKSERKWAIPFVLSSVFLFALGAVIAYIMLPKGLGFLLGFAGQGFVPLITGGRFLGFVMLLAVAFGISFEFPIILIFLCGVGVISSDKLRQWRRGAIVFIAVFAAVITPSADPYTMLAMMIPMVLFYEAAIIVARAMNK